MYPMYPPKFRFITKIYHSNIDEEGQIDCDLFEPGEAWSPTYTIFSSLIAITTCLSKGAYPLNRSGTEVDIFQFMRTAVEWNHQFANGKSVHERGLTLLIPGRYPQRIRDDGKMDIVHQCMVKICGTECANAALLICQFSTTYLVEDLPFHSYQPWLEYIEQSDSEEEEKEEVLEEDDQTQGGWFSFVSLIDRQVRESVSNFVHYWWDSREGDASDSNEEVVV